MFPAPLPFFRLECHFHWYRTSFFQAMFCRSFYEHCHYYSKKDPGSQEKNDSKLRGARLFSTICVSKKILFSAKCGYLDFLRFFIPYVVGKAIKMPFHRNPANFSAQFLIAPVDNFCYTVRKRGFQTIPMFHRFLRFMHYVIHKLLINLCITFQSCVRDC